MPDRPVYPFSALVGQDDLKKALLLNAINPRLGGVLIRGEKGTAKSTAVRAFAHLLPAITVVSDCPYQCDPDGSAQCGGCAARRAAGSALPRSERRVPLVELPLGTSDDRLVGTLNFEHAIKAGERIFEPGLLAAANRGILYVDEVNLLGDHLVDVLLDAAAMGQNYVEREGVSVTHPAEFILIGTMNPEEGDLRPQLLDRFALAVTIEGLRDPVARAEVIRRRIAFEADPARFLEEWRAAEDAERQRISRARSLLPSVRISDQQIETISRICAAFEIDGLRGDIAMYKTAIALAAYAGRWEVTTADLREAATLALLHRRRRQPFDDPSTGRESLDQLLDQQLGDSTSLDDASPERDSSAATSGPTDSSGHRGGAGDESRVFAPGPPPSLPPLAVASRRARQTAPPGRRTRVPSPDQRGYAIGARQPNRPPRSIGEIALGATLRAAAPNQVRRQQETLDGPGVRILPCDVRERRRESKAGNLLLFIVDASGSMAARQRMVAVKGAILSLLIDAYQKRDRVALIVFRGESAELVLPPTASVELAEKRLRLLPTGGRTPLAHALWLGDETIRRSQVSQRGDRPWIILLSDGRPNVPFGGTDVWQDAFRMAERVRARSPRVLVIDTETGPVRVGRNRQLAAQLGGEYLRLEELGASALDAVVRQHLAGR